MNSNLRSNISEKKIETYLRVQVKKVGGKAYKFVSPAQRSVPDRIVVMPEGVISFVEVKRTGGRITEGQKFELEHLRVLGCHATTVWSKADVDYLIKSLLRVSASKKIQRTSA